MGRIPGITTIALLSLVLLAITGCGDDSSSDKKSTTTSPPKTTKESGPKTTTDKSAATSTKGSWVAVADTSKYGKMVTDGKGITLYLFTREKSSESECYGECAKEWPPFLTDGKPVAKSASNPIYWVRPSETTVHYRSLTKVILSTTTRARVRPGRSFARQLNRSQASGT